MPRNMQPKKTAFGADLIEDMKLVLAHQRGKVDLEQVWPKPIDVKAIRKSTKMSQAEFSRAYRISKRALQEWEQGGRQPDSAARAYLTVIAKNLQVCAGRSPANSVRTAKATPNPSQWHSLCQHPISNPRTKAALGNQIDGHVEQRLKIEQQSTEIEQRAPRFQLDQEIDIAPFIAVASRDGTEYTHISGAPACGHP